MPGPLGMDEEACWQALSTRDRSADGRFWYAVRTTGIYCRPSCPARLARRDHVSFHRSPDEARRAGFRPCKRCRPDDASSSTGQTAIVVAACRRIECSETAPTLAELAEHAGMSRFHFHRVFKACTGLTPKHYAEAVRASRVRRGLQRAASVTEAMYEAGFSSSGRFYERTTEMLGMTPSAFRAGGRGASIHFAVGECWLGSILVAASELGVCSVSLGDDPDQLVHELQERFPEAQLTGDDPGFERLVAKVVGAVGASALPEDLPLDVRGTAFQQRVWQALQQIPRGSTSTYQELAARIGRPSAVRAVARACATNVLAVLVPCHRVVRTDGSLSGYRWGVERKRALLRRESER